MKQPARPYPGSRMVDRVAVHGRLQDWPARTVRYISRSWRGPVHIQAEGVDFNLRYIAQHEHVGKGRYPRHLHPHAEILLVMDGNGVIDTDHPEYRRMEARPGDVFVMPPRAVHQSVWDLDPGAAWRLLLIDFDIGVEASALPLEAGGQVDLAFAPFYEWFFANRGMRLRLDAAGWSVVEPDGRALFAALSAHAAYGVGAELLAGTLRLIAHVSRALRDAGIADGAHLVPPAFSRQAALLKARNLMEHRGWFDPGCVGRLAREVGMAESHFVREFKAAYGLTPKKYSQQVLMRRACALLDGTDLPVKDIAARLGYEDPSIFSRAFTRAMSLSPVAYRRDRSDR